MGRPTADRCGCRSNRVHDRLSEGGVANIIENDIVDNGDGSGVTREVGSCKTVGTPFGDRGGVGKEKRQEPGAVDTRRKTVHEGLYLGDFGNDFGVGPIRIGEGVGRRENHDSDGKGNHRTLQTTVTTGVQVTPVHFFGHGQKPSRPGDVPDRYVGAGHNIIDRRNEGRDVTDDLAVGAGLEVERVHTPHTRVERDAGSDVQSRGDLSGCTAVRTGCGSGEVDVSRRTLTTVTTGEVDTLGSPTGRTIRGRERETLVDIRASTGETDLEITIQTDTVLRTVDNLARGSGGVAAVGRTGSGGSGGRCQSRGYGVGAADDTRAGGRDTGGSVSGVTGVALASEPVHKEGGASRVGIAIVGAVVAGVVGV